MFKAILKVNNKDLKAKGVSVEEALNSIKAPVIIKTYGFLTVEQGERSARKMMNVTFTKRFFRNPLLRRIVAKQLNVNFK